MAEATTERRKLAVIGHCGACPHFKGRTRLRGVCLADPARQEVLFAYGSIPEWCPLPDAPTPEAQS